MAQLYLSQRPSLQQTQVKGDMLLTAENTNTIMTRTRAKNSKLLVFLASRTAADRPSRIEQTLTSSLPSPSPQRRSRSCCTMLRTLLSMESEASSMGRMPSRTMG